MNEDLMRIGIYDDKSLRCTSKGDESQELHKHFDTLLHCDSFQSIVVTYDEINFELKTLSEHEYEITYMVSNVKDNRVAEARLKLYNEVKSVIKRIDEYEYINLDSIQIDGYKIVYDPIVKYLFFKDHSNHLLFAIPASWGRNFINELNDWELQSTYLVMHLDELSDIVLVTEDIQLYAIEKMHKEFTENLSTLRMYRCEDIPMLIGE